MSPFLEAAADTVPQAVRSNRVRDFIIVISKDGRKKNLVC